MPEPTFFASQHQWRAWLEAHHDTETECLVGFVKVTTGNANMSWSESVDQALCFGWIDAVRRGIDADRYSIRFARRKPGSNWSAINVKKIEALREAGLMTAAGEAAYQLRSDAKTAIYSYEKDAAEFTPEQLATMQADPDGWAFWEQQPAGYRKQATHWVTDAKRHETKAKRLAQLVTDCAAGLRLRQYRRDT